MSRYNDDWMKWCEMVRRHAELLFGVPFELHDDWIGKAAHAFIEGRSYLDFIEEWAAHYDLTPRITPAPAGPCAADQRL